MIEIVNLTKKYVSKNNETIALKNINLIIQEKRLTAIMGKSGSGKTTLLKAIGGLDTITAGEIIVDGIDISKKKEKELAAYRNSVVGYIFQNYNLEPSFTVLENTTIPAIIKGIDKKIRETRAIELLDSLGLHDKIKNKATELSGGEAQRVSIARALMNDPTIILADEPTGSLDSQNGEMVMQELKRISAEKTVIIVTHDSELAKKYADCIYYLKDGELINENA